MSGYVLGYAGFTLLGGRAADLLGRRRMFRPWLGVFLVFSMLGGFAIDGWMPVVARFVTGVAAAFMTPAAMSIITTSYPEGPQRDKPCWSSPASAPAASRWASSLAGC